MANLWEHVPCNQKTVLEFVQVREKVTISEIQFGLDAIYGEVYSPSMVMRVLKPLQKKGLLTIILDEVEITSKGKSDETSQ